MLIVSNTSTGFITLLKKILASKGNIFMAIDRQVWQDIGPKGLFATSGLYPWLDIDLVTAGKVHFNQLKIIFK